MQKNTNNPASIPARAASAVQELFSVITDFIPVSFPAEKRSLIENLERKHNLIGTGILRHHPTNRGQTAFVESGTARGFETMEEIEAAANSGADLVARSERIYDVGVLEMQKITQEAASIILPELLRETDAVRVFITRIDSINLASFGLSLAPDVTIKMRRILDEFESLTARTKRIVDGENKHPISPASMLVPFDARDVLSYLPPGLFQPEVGS